MKIEDIKPKRAYWIRCGDLAFVATCQGISGDEVVTFKFGAGAAQVEKPENILCEVPRRWFQFWRWFE